MLNISYINFAICLILATHVLVLGVSHFFQAQNLNKFFKIALILGYLMLLVSYVSQTVYLDRAYALAGFQAAIFTPLVLILAHKKSAQYNFDKIIKLVFRVVLILFLLLIYFYKVSVEFTPTLSMLVTGLILLFHFYLVKNDRLPKRSFFYALVPVCLFQYVILVHFSSMGVLFFTMAMLTTIFFNQLMNQILVKQIIQERLLKN